MNLYNIIDPSEQATVSLHEDDAIKVKVQVKVTYLHESTV